MTLQQVGKRRPHLLVCCINYAPEILGTAPYTRDLAEWFAGRGWDVQVSPLSVLPRVAAAPWRPAIGVSAERDGGVSGLALPVVGAGGADRPETARALRQFRRLQPADSDRACRLEAGLHAGDRTDPDERAGGAAGGAPRSRQVLAARAGLRGRRGSAPGLVAPCRPSALKWLESRLLRSFDVVSRSPSPCLASRVTWVSPQSGWCCCPTGPISPSCGRSNGPPAFVRLSASRKAGGSSCIPGISVASKASP